MKPYTIISPLFAAALAAAVLASVSAAAELPDGWTPPTVVKKTNPPHPAAMRMQGIEGAATVIFIVNETGLAEDVTVYSASHRAFGTSLQHAVGRWRFQPALFDGEPVPARARLTANFKLEGAVISMTSADHVAAHMQFAARPDEQTGYRVAHPRDLDAIPRPVHTVMPGIPHEAPPFHERVEIHVDFILAPDGSVRAPAVTQLTESEAAGWLAAAAVEAVRQWRYTAPTVRGETVYAHLTQVVAFEPPR